MELRSVARGNVTRMKKNPVWGEASPGGRPPHRTPLVGILLIIAFVFVSSCTMAAELPHHQKSENLVSFDYKQIPSFSDYLLHTKEQLKQNRVFINKADPKGELEMVAPFELGMKEQCLSTPTKGILLVHGLFGTSFTFKDLARTFHERCFLVRAVLLPGHGTRPADIIDITYKDWVETVDYGIRSLQNEVDEVYIAGFSLGGLLAANATFDHAQIKGAILIAPALGVSAAPIVWNSKWLRYIKDWMVQRPYGIPTRYLSVPINGAAQTYKLSQIVSHKLRDRNKFPIPIMLIVSLEDFAIRPEVAIRRFNFFTKNDTTSRALVFGMSPEQFDNPRIRFVNSNLPEQRIISLSHIALPYSPDNSLFGVDGIYKAYSYDTTPEEWVKNRENYEQFWKGENSYGDGKEPMLRLTYNPLFGEMITEINQFIDNLPE